MKCDELKNYDVQGARLPAMPGKGEFVKRADVDAAIEELKDIIKNNQSAYYVDLGIVANDCEKLKAENRKLKRALWMARAERADDRARIFYFCDLDTMLDIDGYSYDSQKKKGHKKLTARLWQIIWLKVERKCRAKAEECK